MFLKKTRSFWKVTVFASPNLVYAIYGCKGSPKSWLKALLTDSKLLKATLNVTFYVIQPIKKGRTSAAKVSKEVVISALTESLFNK